MSFAAFTVTTLTTVPVTEMVAWIGHGDLLADRHVPERALDECRDRVHDPFDEVADVRLWTPKPKPKPEICDTLVVTQKSLKANGKKQKVTAKVTEGGKAVKGARVVLTGPGIKKMGKTNAKGVVADVTVAPRIGDHPGRDPRIGRACNTQRNHVVGVSEAQVTG